MVAAVPRSPKPTKAPDLMAALEESLAAVRGERDRRIQRGAEVEAEEALDREVLGLEGEEAPAPAQGRQ